MMPSCSQTGTPRHFHSSTTAGSACLMSARTCASILPRQSPNSLILASISLDGDSALGVAVFFVALFFAALLVVALFFIWLGSGLSCLASVAMTGHPRQPSRARHAERMRRLHTGTGVATALGNGRKHIAIKNAPRPMPHAPI